MTDIGEILLGEAWWPGPAEVTVNDGRVIGDKHLFQGFGFEGEIEVLGHLFHEWQVSSTHIVDFICQSPAVLLKVLHIVGTAPHYQILVLSERHWLVTVWQGVVLFVDVCLIGVGRQVP